MYVINHREGAVGHTAHCLQCYQPQRGSSGAYSTLFTMLSTTEREQWGIQHIVYNVINHREGAVGHTAHCLQCYQPQRGSSGAYSTLFTMLSTTEREQWGIQHIVYNVINHREGAVGHTAHCLHWDAEVNVYSLHSYDDNRYLLIVLFVVTVL